MIQDVPFTTCLFFLILWVPAWQAAEGRLRRILDRYIFAELLPPFLLSLGALCLVMLTKEGLRLVQLVVSQGVGLTALLEAFLYLMPSFLVLTLPIAGIIASLTTFSRLSHEKELVAMGMAGLGLLRLSRPVFVFSCLVFGLTLALSQWGQPWSHVSLKRLALSVLRDHLSVALERGVFNEPVPRLVVYVAGAGGGPGAQQPIFISDERNPDHTRLIVAADYRILHDPGSHRAGLRLFNGSVHTRPRGLDRYNQGSFSLYDLPLELDQSLYSPVQERPTRDALLTRLNQTNWRDPDARRRLTEHYKDLAFPTAAFLFGMLGVPVGILAKRSGRVGAFAVGVAVVVAYYMLNVLCDFLVATLLLAPFVGAWLPNAVFLLVAAGLFYRVGTRHAG